ncbi:unnamed protein product [Periconia digitata]|uniref:Uncharacterized protein n=1 Tax=Periconia digitata TaxID=1303443 RepID=A0A9W4UD18_9PLEO|nr:unnamed protein product [Periconia digitata]
MLMCQAHCFGCAYTPIRAATSFREAKLSVLVASSDCALFRFACNIPFLTAQPSCW